MPRTIFPLHPVSFVGGSPACACSEGLTCKSIGAHPAVFWSNLTPGHVEERVDHGRGLATGAKSELFVLDVDMKNGKDGFATLAKLGVLPLPETFTVATPSGGKHFYFQHPGGLVKNSGGMLGKDLGGGLDIRGDGGYVVMPGSSHRNGGTYTVELDVPIAPAPAWLLAWPGLRDTPREATATEGPTPIGPEHKEWEQRRSRAVEACTTFAPSRGDGEGSANLGKIVKRLVWDLVLPSETVVDIIEEHFNPRCTRSDGVPWPWDREELERFIANSRANRTYEPGCAPEGWNLSAKVSRGKLDKALKKAAISRPGTLDRDRLDEELELRGTERCTDTGNVNLFVRFHGSTVRYVEDWAKWLVWDGRRWAPSSEVAVLALTSDVSHARFAWLGVSYTDADPQEEESTAKRSKWATYTANLKGRESIIKLSRAEPSIRTKADALDVDPFLFNVANGTLDLRTGELRPHTPGDLLTKLSDIVYDPSATCPTWDAFLAQVVPDEMTRDYLHRAAGYSLTGSVQEQVLFFLRGEGNNGKSTFMLLVQTIAGEYGQQAPQDLLLARQGESHPTEVAGLKGARLVVCPEIDQGRRWAEARIKALTGGDRISARRMREDFWEFTPTHKIWVGANHEPSVSGTDEGIWRRMRKVPFTVGIAEGDRDKTLVDRLKIELPGILAWAVRGCLSWQAQGLGEAPEITKATKEYRSSEDQVGLFLAERCELGPDFKVNDRELYEAFKRWSLASSYDAPRLKDYKKEFESRGFPSRHTNIGGFRKGLRILPSTANN